MPIKWKLRECLEERGITSASQVSKLVRHRTGYVLSTQAVCDLFNEQPKMIRLETSEALCNAFHCCLNDFVEVVPKQLYALDQLNKSKLLDDSYAVITQKPGISRRAVMRLGVATALTVPLISSIVAPTAAQAASCLPSGASCAPDSACCSNNCTDNGRGGFQCS